MDKYKLLEQDEQRHTSQKTKLGMKILGFCFCAMFLGSVLLNVYYLRNMSGAKNVGHKGHISKYGPEVTMAAKKKILRSSKELRLEQCDGTDCGNGWCCNNPSYSLCCPACDDGTQYCAGDDDDCPDCAIKNIRSMAADKKMLRNQKTVGQPDCTLTDCGDGTCCDFPDASFCCPACDDGTLWCAASADDCCAAKQVHRMAAKKEILQPSKKLAANKKILRNQKTVGQPDCTLTDCGDGTCCDFPDASFCCPACDDGTLWCAASADDCCAAKQIMIMAAKKEILGPSKKLAANKKMLRPSKKLAKEGCDGTDCGNGWCCNDDDYDICCDLCDDGTQWCATDEDCCPDCAITNIRNMGAIKKILRTHKTDDCDECDGTDCGNGWCCNNDDYDICCDLCDDGTQWCAGDEDHCPDCAIKNIQNMAADKKILRTPNTVGQPDCTLTDCGDGTCCDFPDASFCCPACDDGTLWCAASADDCCAAKQVHRMAAKKKILRSSKEPRLEQCDGTDCGNGWCCNNPSYSLCCPACEDGTQYCAGDDDDCPDCTVMNIHNMAAEKRWKMEDVGVCKSTDVTIYADRCDTPCQKAGEDYYWCRTSYDDWDYCSKDNWHTRYGVGCAWACAQKGQSYYWCDRTTGGWDYCSDRC